MLDKIAEKQTSAYINYTYYQTYEWNNFLSHHSTDGLGKMTTAMRYDLVMVNDKPFAILSSISHCSLMFCMLLCWLIEMLLFIRIIVCRQQSLSFHRMSRAYRKYTYIPSML